MPTPTTDELLALFARAGYSRVEPPILQPVDAFLDLSGEDIRRRLFVTSSGDGDELCLRPEYTIPVCRHVLAAGAKAGTQVAHAYLGPVFRLRAGESGEFMQAGIESFGRSDREAADADVIGLAVEACDGLGLTAPQIMLGDMALMAGLVQALGLDAPTRRRLLRGIAAGRGVAALEAEGNGNGDVAYGGLLAAIEGQDPKAARAFVEDVLTIAGISTVGGRTAGEIAERFLTRAARRSEAIAGDAKTLIERYLALRGDPDTVALELRKLTADASIDLDREIDSFEARTGFIAARGIDVTKIVFSAEFARNLDYYTGFIFEFTDPRQPALRPVAAGGRYDGLLEHLGSPEPVPAVGCALWLDRLGAVKPQAGEPAGALAGVLAGVLA